MSIDPSLKVKDALARHRNVLSRAERIEKLKDQEKWAEGNSLLGLPKVANRKVHAAKKEKAAAAEGEAGAVAAAPETAAAAKPAAGAKAAAAKPAAGAKPGAAKPGGKG
jgi:small basic protein (TIGR04137 family)